MMDFLINNFTSYANTYVNVLIEIYLFLVAVMFAYWLKPFVSSNRAAYMTALTYWGLSTINSHIEMGNILNRIMIIGILVITIFLGWLFDNRKNPIQKTFLCLLFRLISWLSMEIFTEIGFFERDLVFSFDWYNSRTESIVIEFLIWNPLVYALSLLSLYIAIRILQKVYHKKSVELSISELIILLTPVCTLLLVRPIITSYFRLWMDGIENGSITQNIPANPYRMMFCIFSFFPIIIIIGLYQQIKESQEKEFILESVKNQFDDATRYTTHIEELYEKMRAMRHDFGNHLTVIAGLAETGSNDELNDYIKELQNRVTELQPSIKTGNAVTDVVLSEFCDQCRDNNIQFESMFTFPENLRINPFDMSVILNNALQNSIEASKEVSEGMIQIKSVIIDKTFIISIRNKNSKEKSINESGLITSTKKDSGHGYGLKNIRSIAGKYKGDIEIHQEEIDGISYFTLNIMMIGLDH
jgi:hypothetical protein